MEEMRKEKDNIKEKARKKAEEMEKDNKMLGQQLQTVIKSAAKAVPQIGPKGDKEEGEDDWWDENDDAEYRDENAAVNQKLKEMKTKMKESHKGFEERDKKRAETDSSFREH